MSTKMDSKFFVCRIEETLFVDTNLNTHLALPFTETDTIAGIKEKIMHGHLIHHPDLGPIKICSLKVKRGGKFYHLTDHMLVASVFWCVENDRFFHADVSRTGHVSGEDNQISDDITEELCLATDLVSPGTQNMNRPLKEYTLFIDTDLDTHLASAIFETETVADIKGKIMHEHLIHHPDLGSIKICEVKVKRGEKFYDLTDDMIVVPAFAGVRCSWLLYVDVSRDGNVAGKDQISDDTTEKLCLAADLVSPGASAGIPLN